MHADITTGPQSLQDYLQQAEASGQLVRIGATIDPGLELAAIVDRNRSTECSHKALLFERVKGSALPVAANLFGSRQLAGLALGLNDIPTLVSRLHTELSSVGTSDPEAALRLLCRKEIFQPRTAGYAECREVVASGLGLELLPKIKSWPGDSAEAMTLAQVVTVAPDCAVQNSGLYRVRIVGPHTAIIGCHKESGMAAHLRAWAALGKPAPVAVVLGGPPILTWASSAPLPEGVDEMSFCGYLAGRPLSSVSCEAHGLNVPASAEVVIEGEVRPGAVAEMGRFGNHTGHYVDGGTAPVMTVHRVTTRTNPVCPWTLVGPPPRENLLLAKIGAQVLLPLLTLQVPTVTALSLPDEAVFHGGAVVTVARQEDRPLTELAAALRRSVLLRGSRLLVIGADDHSPEDLRAVFWRVLNRTEWQRDVLIEGNRLTIDARRTAPGLPVAVDPVVAKLVERRWHDYGFG